jgi:hypothetical protein
VAAFPDLRKHIYSAKNLPNLNLHMDGIYYRTAGHTCPALNEVKDEQNRTECNQVPRRISR